MHTALEERVVKRLPAPSTLAQPEKDERGRECTGVEREETVVCIRGMMVVVVGRITTRGASRLVEHARVASAKQIQMTWTINSTTRAGPKWARSDFSVRMR